MSRLVVRGKYLFEDGHKFLARGVSYGPFAPNSRGEHYPEPELAAADFALMRELGVNVVRTYEPPPPWMFEQAAKIGLRLMAGIPWPYHMAFLDSRELMRDIRKSIRTAVAEMREFGDAIFAYTLGNEIRSDIVRWHGPRAVSRFLAELCDIGKQLDPQGLFTYANYPSAEYLSLNFLDFLSFNVYLHRESDFRRYLTHLLAISGDQPLVLSETGMDTIREGEAHQAELLGWQTRAAFELGLSGFVVFAFTDAWHRGGAEITDWAFGLVTRERQPKRAFDAVKRVFAAPIPPPLQSSPRASVIVAAHNGAATLQTCLTSLKKLNHPDYEVIVVDDGSTDTTASIAEAAGAKLVRGEHRGLGAARNAGVAAASGEVVAFIDADAQADPDWLYHLVETMLRSGAEAAGGLNFPPPPQSAVAAAIAAAPGAPREVASRDDTLAQLCGCSMAIAKSALKTIGGFDPLFTYAGDDVDLSWRLRRTGATLAYASGATVIHERRRTLRGYLAQQYGYGVGEGLLYRKYPLEDSGGDAIYRHTPWWPLRARARVYYGAFGRGLFQTIYPGDGESSLSSVALHSYWVLAALAAAFFLPLIPAIGWIGIAAFTLSAAVAGIAAWSGQRGRVRLGFASRAVLWLLEFLGPVVRSWPRARARDSFRNLENLLAPGRPRLGGTLRVRPIGNSAAWLEELRSAMVRRGAAVARGESFDAFDLMVLPTPALRVPINALSDSDGYTLLRWRTVVRPWRVVGMELVLAFLLFVSGLSASVTALILLAGLGLSALATLLTVSRLPGLLQAAADDVARGQVGGAK